MCAGLSGTLRAGVDLRFRTPDASGPAFTGPQGKPAPIFELNGPQ